MSKWFGKVGYVTTTEITPGYWDDIVVEKEYFGDVVKVSTRFQNTSDSTVIDITVNNQFSIIADPFAYANFSTIKYVEYMGTKWKVTHAEVQFPRLLLTVGGVYNGE